MQCSGTISFYHLPYFPPALVLKRYRSCSHLCISTMQRLAVDTPVHLLRLTLYL